MNVSDIYRGTLYVYKQSIGGPWQKNELWHLHHRIGIHTVLVPFRYTDLKIILLWSPRLGSLKTGPLTIAIMYRSLFFFVFCILYSHDREIITSRNTHTLAYRIEDYNTRRTTNIANERSILPKTVGQSYNIRRSRCICPFVFPTAIKRLDCPTIYLIACVLVKLTNNLYTHNTTLWISKSRVYSFLWEVYKFTTENGENRYKILYEFGRSAPRV